MGMRLIAGRRRGMLVHLGFLAGAFALALVAGCGGGADESPQPGGSVSVPPSSSPTNPTSPASPSPASPTPPASQPPPATTPGQKPTGGAQMTITGQVVEGVEAGCLLLHTADSKDYLLVMPAGVDRSAVRAGARLRVRGQFQPGLMSYCQQGTPFVVSEVGPA